MNKSFFKLAMLVSILPVGAYAADNNQVASVLEDLGGTYRQKCLAHSVTERLFSSEIPPPQDKETANELAQAYQTIQTALKEMHDGAYQGELKSVEKLKTLVRKKDRPNFVNDHPDLDPAVIALLLESRGRFNQHFSEESED